jgi:hypothetical protein
LERRTAFIIAMMVEAAFQKTTIFLLAAVRAWNFTDVYRVYETQPLSSTMNQIIPEHIRKNYCFKKYFNIIYLPLGVKIIVLDFLAKSLHTT